jgi:hypothetical protein
MGIDAVRLEMVGECSKAQFVEDTTLVDAEIVLNFVVAPICEVLGIVVDLSILANCLPRQYPDESEKKYLWAT